jgi:GDP/UDP-N,N'-diacetylbacillosamine 2-epimerase (hydrolysing)
MKKICVFTGTRADFGLLKPLLLKIKMHEELELQIVATTMHMSPHFGETYKEIIETGFTINKKVECLLSGDTANAVTKSMGLALIGFADALSDLEPDLAIILGDRTEMLMAASACSVANVPLGHLHGGEVTEGAYDDAFRHAISKMSSLHFTATEEYRNRVIQLGENPENVFNVGAIGIDSIKTLNLMDKAEFEASIGFKLNEKNILITYHPVTLEENSAAQHMREILAALKELKDTNFIFTYANSDKSGAIINQMIEEFVKNNSQKSCAFPSLGQLRYLSALQHVDIVLGNSSSGILEVPYFKIPTINIGDRQKGRVMPSSVFNCNANKTDILSTIQHAEKYTSSEEFTTYGIGNAAQKILDIIEKKLQSINLKKGFFDLKSNQ